MTEIWKSIPGYSKYEVSSLGNVRGPKGILSPSHHSHGYCLVSLMRDDNSKATENIHRLVCMTFKADSWFPGAMALHKDHNKRNNVEDNLYWGTHKQNVEDDITNPRSTRRLNMQKAQEIRAKVKAGAKQVSVAREYNVSPWTITNIMSNKIWRTSE
ncbi:NUMOD4 domain-containing protein [Parvimonas sp. M13]|uniref:NUMOD4 domain-containing protein n=2 Tax=unclassified Parvimonas TaxID=1151464 RepID=UPI002B4A76BD|nr:NUMOD4 domain-containing protein [Parvimonas sp. M13]MEB3025834.1 NUMOD4 domain-containing protein [Parvimonas sp. M13]